MSPLDQGKYASYLFYHGLLDKAGCEMSLSSSFQFTHFNRTLHWLLIDDIWLQHQYEELDRIDTGILEMIREGDWLTAWKASDEQLNFILTSLNYSNLYDMSKDQYRPSTMNFWSWLNLETTRAAIHVGDLEFSDGLQVYMAMVEDTMRSIKPMLGKFLANIYIYRMLEFPVSMVSREM